MIELKLTEKQFEALISELHELESYRWNDDHVHADECCSEMLQEIKNPTLQK